MSAARLARMLFDEAGYIAGIASAQEYQQACALLDELMDDALPNPRLLGLLARSLAQWEAHATAFEAFNRAVHCFDDHNESVSQAQ